MTEDAGSPTTGPAPEAGAGRRRIRVGAVVAVALLIGFGVWLVLRSGSSSSSSTTPTLPERSNAVPISAAGLETISSTVGIPIYWAGEKPGYTYELTKTADNRVYVRYLPAGVAVGTKAPYRTIGTYPVKNAFTVTSKLAAAGNAVKIDIGKTGVAFYTRETPTNVYMAYRGLDSQIEVYDPSAALAHQLVSSGQISSVSQAGPSTTSGAHKTSPAELRALAAELQHPIYWAGSEPGVTYELTRTSAGRIYLRYLAAGAAVGTQTPYLTIGTYPLENAFAVTREQSQTPGTALIKIGGGGVAFYKKSGPTNVYLAYPGVDVQVEVYDPSAAHAHGLVASQSVTAVG